MKHFILIPLILKHVNESSPLPWTAKGRFIVNLRHILEKYFSLRHRHISLHHWSLAQKKIVSAWFYNPSKFYLEKCSSILTSGLVSNRLPFYYRTFYYLPLTVPDLCLSFTFPLFLRKGSSGVVFVIRAQSLDRETNKIKDRLLR